MRRLPADKASSAGISIDAARPERETTGNLAQCRQRIPEQRSHRADSITAVGIRPHSAIQHIDIARHDHQLSHGFEPRDLGVEFVLLPAGQFLPTARRRNPHSETMQKLTHLIQPEAAGLRQTQDRNAFNSIGGVAPLSANPKRFRQHPDPFPITDCGSRRAAFRHEFTDRHIYYSS